MKPEISIVIPAFNESENLNVIIPGLISFFEAEGRPSFELCIVDDGSDDRTLSLLRAWNKRDLRVRYLSLAKNCGQVLAIVAGLHSAKGRAVIMMDADLQHPLEMLPHFISHWQMGYHIVNTQRLNANGFFSTLFYRAFKFWTGIPVKVGFADFRLMDRRVVDVVCGISPEEVFLRGLIPTIGFEQITLQYCSSARLHGETKYSFRKNVRLAFKGLITQASVGFSLPFYLLLVTPLLLFLRPSVAIAFGFAAVFSLLGIFGIYFRKSYLSQVAHLPAFIVKESSEDPIEERTRSLDRVKAA